jgi:glutamate synthase domain-containing protein 3
VRNSGAHAVVEGVGDHACEYMTGGRVVVLGMTGRNFAAGMSGGIAYVLDADGQFARRANRGMVDLEGLGAADETFLQGIIERHVELTASELGRRVLEDWPRAREQFVMVMPRDYKRVVQAEAHAASEGRPLEFAEMVGVARG